MNRKGKKRSSNSNSSDEEDDSKREIQSLREMGSSSNSKMEKAIVGLSGEGENATLSLSPSPCSWKSQEGTNFGKRIP